LQDVVSEEFCPQAFRQALKLQVPEVRGESTRVEAGRTYAARGRYTLGGPRVTRLCLSALGRGGGTPADLAPGSGTFELTVTPEEVVTGRDRELDLLMFDKAGMELGIRLCALLQTSR